jgi:hypothetical protein
MKKYLFLLVIVVASAAVAQTPQSLEERIAKLEEKLEEFEIDKSYDRLQVSGTYINYLETINATSKNGTTGKKIADTGEIMSMHVALNFDVNINKNIDFYTTLGMGKVWNNDGREGESQSSYRSYQGSYGYAGSAAKFDVAYIRWKTDEERWSFALGRMTTRGGPPMNQLDALSRNGTYPRFGYNAIFDGVAVVHDFKASLPKDYSVKTRLFYTPTFYLDSSDRKLEAQDADNNTIDRRSNQLTWLNEVERSNTSFAKKISLYSMLWYYDRFYDSEYQSSTREGVEYYRALSHSLYLGFERIAGSGVNFSWSNLRVNSKSDGGTVNRSDAHLFNLNYTFASDHVLGVEQIFTDRSFYIDDWSYLQFNDFYQRPSSSGQHVFGAISFPHRQVLRLGVYNYQAKVDRFAGFDSKQTTQNFYASYRIDF